MQWSEAPVHPTFPDRPNLATPIRASFHLNYGPFSSPRFPFLFNRIQKLDAEKRRCALPPAVLDETHSPFPCSLSARSICASCNGRVLVWQYSFFFSWDPGCRLCFFPFFFSPKGQPHYITPLHTSCSRDDAPGQKFYPPSASARRLNPPSSLNIRSRPV